MLWADCIRKHSLIGSQFLDLLYYHVDVQFEFLHAYIKNTPVAKNLWNVVVVASAKSAFISSEVAGGRFFGLIDVVFPKCSYLVLCYDYSGACCSANIRYIFSPKGQIADCRSMYTWILPYNDHFYLHTSAKLKILCGGTGANRLTFYFRSLIRRLPTVPK